MRTLVLIALCVASASVCAQSVQKWVDEKGRVHYGAKPPGAAKEESIKRGTMSTPGGSARESRTARSGRDSGTPSGSSKAPGGGPMGRAFSEESRQEFSRQIGGAIDDGRVRPQKR